MVATTPISTTKARTGAALAAARWNAADIMSVASFARATAEKFGLTDRHVRRMISVGSCLDANDIACLRGAPKPVALADLQVIAKAEPTQRHHIVAALAAGSAKSAAAARTTYVAREKGLAPTVKDPVEEAFRALKAAWQRAPKAGRRRFVEDHRAELLALIGPDAGEAV